MSSVAKNGAKQLDRESTFPETRRGPTCDELRDNIRQAKTTLAVQLYKSSDEDLEYTMMIQSILGPKRIGNLS